MDSALHKLSKPSPPTILYPRAYQKRVRDTHTVPTSCAETFSDLRRFPSFMPYACNAQTIYFNVEIPCFSHVYGVLYVTLHTQILRVANVIVGEKKTLCFPFDGLISRAIPTRASTKVGNNNEIGWNNFLAKVKSVVFYIGKKNTQPNRLITAENVHTYAHNILFYLNRDGKI